MSDHNPEVTVASEAIAEADQAFAMYQSVRHRLPQADFPATSQMAATMADLADEHDVFLLDAFGVLNIGEEPIPGVAQRIARLRSEGKQVYVVTNAAAYPASHLLARYDRMGYDFEPHQVVSSRDTLTHALSQRDARRWGIMASRSFDVGDLGAHCIFLGDDPAIYDAVDGFILIGSGEWSERRQDLLATALLRSPRPVLVGNPDLVAPLASGLAVQPGYYAHRLADATGVEPEFFGKPFANIYELAFERFGDRVPRERVVMVGDTLHTDVLGGAAAGVRTALVAGYGLLAEGDPHGAIAASGIVPDFILGRP
ncbi:MAG: TIGR01459 family HAD-type hydrolase [Hyphomicrobiales bacterium]|nr:MAG: TIGR01459 family HAD-type hydrolase [Hyphomicrobiales bacterium]